MSLIDLLVNRARQAKACLFSLRHNIEAIVVYSTFAKMIMFIFYFAQAYPSIKNKLAPKDYIFDDWYLVFNDYTKYFFDYSFTTLIIISSLSYKWRFGKWAVILLCIMWCFTNLILASNFKVDFYWWGGMAIIFLIFTIKFFRYVSNR